MRVHLPIVAVSLGLAALGADASRSASEAPGTPQEGPPALVARLPWGEGPAALGRIVPAEHAPEGPQAILVLADGSMAVLDSVQSRILRLSREGAPIEVFDLPSQTWEAIAERPDGGLVVMDRLVQTDLLVLDASGREDGRVELEGRVPEPGLITALRGTEDGFWVEVEHGDSLRVASPDGTETTATLPGRPLGGGGSVRANRSGEKTVSLLMFQDGRPLTEKVVRFTQPVLQIGAIESDGRDGLWVAAETLTEAGPWGEASRITTEVVHLEARPGGRELSRRTHERLWSPYEPLQPFASTPDGGLIQLVTGEDGAEIWRW